MIFVAPLSSEELVLHEALTDAIIARAIRVHRRLGPGFLESVYQNALTFELRRAGLQVVRERRITVFYETAAVGDFIADVVVNSTVIVEIKANREIAPANLAQLSNYLTATRMEVGLLVNFGAEKLQVKRRLGVRVEQTRNAEPVSDQTAARTRSEEQLDKI